MNLSKLRQGIKLEVNLPETDTDTHKEKKRTRAAIGMGAVSAATGATMLSRNENSVIGRGLAGAGALAGIVASEFDAQAKQKKRTKESREAR